MRMTKDHDGNEWDLDDPATYSGLSQDKWEVVESIYKNVGYAKIYITEAQLSGIGDWYKEQNVWIDNFVNEIAKEFRDNLHNQSLIWWQEKLWLFLDQTENMC